MLTLAATSAFEVAADELHAFATSTIGPGDLHSWPDVSDSTFFGLRAADEICRSRADAAGLSEPKRYVAWLSDRNDDAYCRLFGLGGKKSANCGQATLPVGAGPWLRTDGMPFAAKIEDALAENVIYSPLDVDEFGDSFAYPAESFTATDETGAFNTFFEDNGDCEE